MTRPLAVEGRVAAREPTKRDRDEFLKRVHASAHLHRPWVNPPASREEFAKYLARCREDNFQAYLLTRREDEAMVGIAALSQIFYGPLKSAYLGFSSFVPYAGRGYMTDGLNAVLRHAFRTLRLHRVEANIQPGNARSIAVVRRLGFRREGFSPRYLKVGGRWRDHERWAILVDEWPRR